MLGSRELEEAYPLVNAGRQANLTSFTLTLARDTVQGFFLTLEKSLRFIPKYVVTRPKDFLNCAAIYVAVAVLVELIQGHALNARVLVTAALVGGLISPFVIPWMRAFPLTGNPVLSSTQRVLSFGFNVLAHFLSVSSFVWVVKGMIALTANGLLDLSWEIPGFFGASIAFVLVNNCRKIGTEYLGMHWFIFFHPQARQDIARVTAAHPELNPEQCRLHVWNDWREIGNGYAFWRSTAEKPIGIQYWISISKVLDSVALTF